MDKGSIISLTVSLVLSAALAVAVVLNQGGDNPRGESLIAEKVVTVVIVAPLLAAFVFCISLLLRGKFTNPKSEISGASLGQGFLYLAWALLACASIYFYAKAFSQFDEAERHLQDAERHFQDAERALRN